jgi:hypothetical protein
MNMASDEMDCDFFERVTFSDIRLLQENLYLQERLDKS